jgi:hypothetical protein
MKKILIILTLMLTISFFGFGEEGIWMLTQVKNLGLDQKGFEIGASDIYDPAKPCIAQAIVHLGGGTAELISPNGLILTNHHVAFGAVQRASTQGTDFITQGFLAKVLEEEIKAPGYSAQILEEMKDVTNEFKRFDKIKDPVKREQAIEARIKAMTEKIEKGRKDIAATIEKMFEGREYILFVHKRFDDVRVVYVPPAAIGNYGGDIDNWMWPRHTGDFSFMRIYMAPDGTGRKYDKANVPYKPKYWLKIAKEGLKKSDMTFIMGYPGRTRRFRTSNSVEQYLKHFYPERIRYYKEVIDMMGEFAKDSPIAKAKVAGIEKGLNNAMKNYQGQVEGMIRGDFLGRKLAFEKNLTEFLATDKSLQAKYGDVLEKIKKQHDFIAEYWDKDELFSLADSRRPLCGYAAGTAFKAYYTAGERAKPEKRRDPDFSEKDTARWVDGLDIMYMSYYEPADRALLKKWLERADKLPENLHMNELDDFIAQNGGSIDRFIDAAYKNTKITDPEYAKSLFSKSLKELNAMDDPFIKFARASYAEAEAYRKRDLQNTASLADLRKNYIEALYAWKGGNLYPDANSTIRFSYGPVEGYQPRDAVYYEPFTTIKGMLEKDTGVEPFNVPEGVKQLYTAKDFGRWQAPWVEDVPIAFTHKVDSTGGNSGSPVLNTRGELVGILFDGNYESMTSDWQFDDAITRSISADIRFVMFITEKLAKAENILKELGLNK